MEKRPPLRQVEEGDGKFGGFKFRVTRVLIGTMVVMVMVVLGQSKQVVRTPIYLYSDI